MQNKEIKKQLALLANDFSFKNIFKLLIIYYKPYFVNKDYIEVYNFYKDKLIELKEMPIQTELQKEEVEEKFFVEPPWYMKWLYSKYSYTITYKLSSEKKRISVQGQEGDIVLFAYIYISVAKTLKRVNKDSIYYREIWGEPTCIKFTKRRYIEVIKRIDFEKK